MKKSRSSEIKKTAKLICRVVILPLAFGLTFWTFTLEQNSHKVADKVNQICKGDTRPVPFKRLSDEKNFPFLMFGHPPSVWHKNQDYEAIRESVARFPNVRSCLIKSEKEKQIPNLTLFDWNAVKGTKDAEVCVFRIATSIGGIEGTKQWLISQGLGITDVMEIPASIVSLTGEQKPGTRINASWSTKICGLRFREIPFSPLDQLYQRLIAYGVWFSIEYSADERVSNVIINFNTE
jgi:hypothetical protein